METANPVSKKLKLVITIALVLALGGVVAAGMMWAKLNKLSNSTATEPQTDEVAQVVAEIGEFLLLPENETPNLLTVSDLETVKGQPFFARALLGDKVLVYATAAKAILWRPSTKKIIEVYPINLNPTN